MSVCYLTCVTAFLILDRNWQQFHDEHCAFKPEFTRCASDAPDRTTLKAIGQNQTMAFLLPLFLLKALFAYPRHMKCKVVHPNFILVSNFICPVLKP